MSKQSLRIRRARQSLNLTQAAFAEKIAVHRSAVSQWENAHGTSPRVDNLVRIAHLCKVNFEWLATGRGAHQNKSTNEVDAINLNYFAETEVEEQMFNLFRRLPAKKQRLACAILELLGK